MAVAVLWGDKSMTYSGGGGEVQGGCKFYCCDRRTLRLQAARVASFWMGFQRHSKYDGCQVFNGQCLSCAWQKSHYSCVDYCHICLRVLTSICRVNFSPSRHSFVKHEFLRLFPPCQEGGARTPKKGSE